MPCIPVDVYVVGCTNVGKSSLFSTLLDSDLCKVSAFSIVGAKDHDLPCDQHISLDIIKLEGVRRPARLDPEKERAKHCHDTEQ